MFRIVRKYTVPVLKKVEILSQTPAPILSRLVFIYQPCKNTMQSGQAEKEWKIDYDVSKRWENELMGWSSSADQVQALQLRFKSKEDAIEYCKKQGLEFRIQESKEATFKVRSYAANFKYNPTKLTWHHTK